MSSTSCSVQASSIMSSPGCIVPIQCSCMHADLHQSFYWHKLTSKPCSLKLSMVQRHQAMLWDCLLDMSPIK